MHKTIPLKPRLSEKAYNQSQADNVYVFDVPTDINKHTVARAVSAQFEVEVEKVNITNVSGKPKRTVSKGGRRVMNGKRVDIKKAYVTIKKGQTLPIFAAVEAAEEKQEALQEKVDKAASKQADKESKPKRSLSLRGMRGKKKDEQ